MKLALLANRSSIHTTRLANEMVSRGHEVSLITMHRGGDRLSEGIRLCHLPFSPPHGYYLNIFSLKNILRRIRPHLLHAHFASGYGTLGRLSGFRPYILSIWGSDVYDFPYRSSSNRRTLRKNLSHANWLCSTSRAMAEHTLRLYPFHEKKLSVTPFGIDLNLFKPSKGHRDPSTITIGTVKTLSPTYGIDILIRAFAKVHGFLKDSSPEIAQKLRLLIVGGGQQRRELENLAAKLGLKEVTEFAGAVRHEQVPHYLNRMDIYVAASRLESFGVAILEASACCLPVVVSDIGGLPEVVIHRETGFVVEKENVEEISEKLVLLIKNPSLRSEMGNAGRRHVIENYNWTDNINLMEKIYAQVS